jgi:hypothetical protein
MSPPASLSSTASPTIAFRGLASRSGRLTWGQRWSFDILRDLSPAEHRLNLWLWVAIPDGYTMAELVAVLTELVSTHEILRTTYHIGSDGQPEQRVRGEGDLPILVRAATRDQGRQAVEGMRSELLADRFDLAADLPIRLGVVTCDGAPAVLEVALSFLAADDWTMHLICQDVPTRLAAHRAAGSGAAGWETVPPDQPPQPLDQAEFECSDQAASLARAGYRYWAEQLTLIKSIPASPQRGLGELPRYWNGALTSPALSQAARALGERLGVPASAVLLAGLTALLGAREGQPATGLFLAVNNRYRPAARAAYGVFRQNVPLHLDLCHETFGDLAQATAVRMFRASRYGQADPVALANLMEGPNQGRGAHLALPVVFDYHHQPPPAAESSDDQLAAVRRAAKRSTFRWLDTADTETLRLYVKVPRSEDHDQFWFWIDTAYLSRADLAALAFGWERLTIEALAGEVPMSDVARVAGLTTGD